MMVTYLIAYLIVWLGVAAFVARLGIRQKLLRRSVEELQQKLRKIDSSTADAGNPSPESRAA
jgi:CcmD family protein